MFRASSLPGKPGRFRASDYLCSSEHACIGCIAQIPMFRAVPSYSLLGTLLLCSARNIASLPASMLGTLLLCLLLCSEHFFLLCSARNTASLPASVLGTLPPCLLLCPARNITSLPASSYALLGTLLPCLLLCSEYCFLLCSVQNSASTGCAISL